MLKLCLYRGYYARMTVTKAKNTVTPKKVNELSSSVISDVNAFRAHFNRIQVHKGQ